MVQRAGRLRLLLEAAQPLRVRREASSGRTLIATSRFSFSIARTVHLAHAPGADRREDLVEAESVFRLSEASRLAAF